VTTPCPRFDHLLHMTDRRGTFEHACLDQPRPEYGYCTDDMARVLIVATRQPDPERTLHGLAGLALRFLNEAQAFTGACRNRMDSTGRWADEPATEDSWGRCLWGLGTAAAHSAVAYARQLAVVQFEQAAQVRSTWPRAMAFAALGAAEILSVNPDHRAARKLLTDYAGSLPTSNDDTAWPWPEPRLTYANAVLTEAMIAAGNALDDPTLRDRGLNLLAWLLDYETADGHLSPTPVAGRGPNDPRPAFDQQAIEVSTLADACARAAAVDPRVIWSDGVLAAAAWFQGDNDAGQPMWDPETGGGFDGLRADGVNRNQGAESTLAVISTFQHARRFSTVPPASVHAGLVTRSPQRLAADPSRVITRLFVPGQEGFERQESRAGAVLARILVLDEDEVRLSLGDVISRFDGRHRDLVGTFRRHARELTDRLDPDAEPSEARMLLLGATFTSEYAIEGAALCNPSIVAHPDQTGTAAGSLRFVMSVRGIGEGHRSSVGFRTGVIDASGRATIDNPAPFATVGAVMPALLDAAVFRSELARLDDAGEAADYILDALGDRFTRADLDDRLERLQTNLSTRGHARKTMSVIRAIAERTYAVEFSDGIPLSARVLWPAMGAEAVGMEDARFVRFVDDDGSVTFYATYTAYSGSSISQQLLETTDFQSFICAPMVGPAVANKGLALFPRRIHGRYAALSRFDRESNAIAYSDHLPVWTRALGCQRPTQAWEALQLGNCGPPIETDAGWLVLTHGVGPMRTYRIGAILLDLDDPTRIIGQLQQPLLSPATDEQNGYVPNVVYSCGALVHADTLVLPYGIGDAAIGIATVPMPELLAALRR
jgi:predicted GH43/DUF377 family glycosyl hydrolase